MDVSRVARTVTLGTVTAVVVALAGFGWTPTASAAAGDETGLMKAGSFAQFDVLANDSPGPDWYAEPVDTSDPTVSGGFDATLSVDLFDNAGFTGAKAIPYHVFDGNGELQRTSTLTVQVTPAVLVAQGGNGQVTLSWPGLPGSVDGARISYGTDDVDVSDHTPEPGKTTVIQTGAAPWTITGLTNGTVYTFYVTPRIGATEMYRGESATRSPRTGTNALPVATDDTVSMVDDDQKFFSPTDNDTDADDDLLQIIGHTAAAHGVLNCDRYGCDYDPTGARQNDTFAYTVSDGYGGTDSGTVNLVARSATLANDTATTPATKDKVIDVLANDLGIQGGDEVFVNSVSGGASAAVRPDRTVLFRAPTAGDYTFTYRVYTSDGEQLGTATAAITVSAAPPISANPDSGETAMGVATTIPVGVNDAINPANFPLDNAGTTVVTGPGHGAAVVDYEPRRYGSPQRLRNLPVIIYTPTRHWKGTDTFRYQIKDYAGNADTATVAVTVGTPGPDYVYTDDELGQTDVNWVGKDSPDIDQIKVCYATSSDLATPPAYPTRPCATEWPVAGTPDSLHVTGLTNGNVYVGSVFFHYDDGTPAGVWSDGETFEAFPGVGGVDSVWSEGGTTTPANNPGKIRVFWTNPTSSAGTTLAWSTSYWPASPASAGANTLDAAQGATQVDLPGLTEGTRYYISIFAKNLGGGYSRPEQLRTVLLRATNAAPSAVNDVADVILNQSTFIDPLDNDTDADAGDAQGIRGNTNPAHGTVACSLFSCRYTPATGYVGSDSFTYTLSDGHFGTASGTVSLTVGGPHHPVGGTDSYTATINKAFTFDLDDTASDPDRGPLTYSNFSALAGLSCQANGACTYTGAAVGNDFPFTFTVTDNTSLTGTGTIHLKVVPNQLPVVPTQFLTVNTGTSIPITLSATDPDGDPLTFAAGDRSTPQKGALTCTTPTTCTYNQNIPGMTGRDSFFYSVDDGHGTLVWGEVYLTLRVAAPAGTATIVRGGAATRSVNAALRVTGTLSPARPGTTVKLQRLVGATWTDVASAVESSTGAYAFSLKQPTGSWKFRVTSPEVSGRGATTSPVVTAGFYAVSMPSQKASGDKYVTIKNTGKVAVNLKGWTITTKAKKVLTLPSYSLAVGKSVRIHPGPGRTRGADVYLRKTTSLFALHESLTLRDLAKVTVATRKW